MFLLANPSNLLTNKDLVYGVVVYLSHVNIILKQ